LNILNNWNNSLILILKYVLKSLLFVVKPFKLISWIFSI